jgi:NAD(P)-dependent dehydrogenase (short-subunit alcohol dehydrogenase family)
MADNLSDRVVVITGGSRGIGQALAWGFASDGAKVAIFGRNHQDLEETASANPEQIECIAGDITNESDVDRLMKTTIDRFGPIDILINNAGIINKGSLLERPFEDWQAVIEVNVIGLAMCTYKVLPGMIDRGYGRIINLASRAAEQCFATWTAYSSSKAAVASFTKSIAAEVGPPEHPDILINALIPGPTSTNMLQESGLDPSMGQDPKVVYPHTKFVVDLPPNGPHGKIFWNSKEYEIYTEFND